MTSHQDDGVPQDDLRLSDIERRYLDKDGYDQDGHLSRSKPGDTLRELIHEIRQTRTAIRLAQATFVSKVDLEERLKTAGVEIARLRKQSTRRLWVAVGVVSTALAALGVGGGLTAYEIRHQQLQSTYERCVQSNAFRQGDKELWDEVIGLSKKPNPTPQEQQTITSFEAFLARHDQPIKCTKP